MISATIKAKRRICASGNRSARDDVKQKRKPSDRANERDPPVNHWRHDQQDPDAYRESGEKRGLANNSQHPWFNAAV